jgi:threonine synthase
LFAKLAQGFHELTAVGLAHGASPRLIGAQSSRCAPVAAAYSEGLSRAVGDDVYGDLAIGAARASGGAVLAVDDRLVGGYRQLVEVATGGHVDESAGIALGAVVHGVRSGAIRSGDTVVLVVSGSALDDAAAEPRRAIPPRLGRVLEELGAS